MFAWLPVALAATCLVLLWSFGLSRGSLDPAGLSMMGLLSAGILALAFWRPAGPPPGARGDAPTDELQRTNEHLQRRNADLSVFAKAASHDMKEPLRKIESFGRRLLDRMGPLPDETEALYVGRMIDAAERMRILIEDLREYSRLDETPLSGEPVDLAAIASAVIAERAADIKSCGARIDVQDLPWVKADREQMKLLFAKLLDNALKYTRQDMPPDIAIRGRVAPDGGVVVEFADTGIGFEPRHAERIFQVLERLHSRGEYPGTGIGLAACRRIAQRHGGTLTARGEIEKGAVFTLILPRAQANLSNETPTSGPASQ